MTKIALRRARKYKKKPHIDEEMNKNEGETKRKQFVIF